MSEKPPNPLLGLLGQIGGKLLASAVEGATDAVLEEVQGALENVNGRIGTARKKAKSRRAPAKRPPPRDVEIIDAEVVDEKAERH